MVATVLVQAAVFAGRPMTSYRALDLGASTLEVGVVVAAFAVLPLILAVPAGRGVDGDRAVVLLRTGAACSLAGALTMAMAGSLITLAVGNMVAGIGLLLSAVSVQGLIARRSARAGHDRAFGLFTVAASVGQLIGPLLSGTAAHQVARSNGGHGPQSGLLVAAGLAGLLLVVALAYRDEQHESRRRGDTTRPARVDGSAEPGPTGVVTILRTRGMQPAMLASLALLTAVDLITAFLPVLAEERGISTRTVGWLLALRALASIASRLLVARFAARWGRRHVIAVSMLLAAVMLLVLPVSPFTSLLVVLMLVAGFSLGIGQPLTMSWVSGLVSERSRATALAVRLGANRVGQVLVPTAAGAVAGMAGTGGVFVLTGGLLSIASVGVLVSRPDVREAGG